MVVPCIQFICIFAHFHFDEQGRSGDGGSACYFLFCFIPLSWLCSHRNLLQNGVYIIAFPFLVDDIIVAMIR